MPEQPHVTFATWNLCESEWRRDERIRYAATMLDRVDVLCVQEVVVDEDGNGTVFDLARLSGMTLAVAAPYGFQGGERSGLAILSRLPVLTTHTIDMPAAAGPFKETRVNVAAELALPSGRTMLAISSHFPWGGQVEHRRLAHAVTVDGFAEARAAELGATAIVTAAGDWNALPDGDTVRFMRGLNTAGGNMGTLWTDAWQTAGEGDGYSSDPRGNLISARTAHQVGILAPGMIPPRRIDYVMVKGFAHGRAGTPLHAELFGTEPDGTGLHASDHFGIVTRLWDPPVE